jgi:5-methylcytosine-specific restriction endonuclease McrA
MHLDRDPGNNEDWNLVTACRPCHVAYDAPDLAAARSEARLRTRIGAGQLELFHMGEFERL